MSTDPTGGIGRQLVRAACIALFVAWALTTVVHLLESVWLDLTVIGVTVALCVGVAMWWRSRRNSW